MKRFFHDKVSPHVIPTIILLAVTLAVYLRTLGHDFQLFWDDEKYVTANDTIKGFTLENLKGAFTTFTTGNYAPVQTISYMFDYQLWGMKAAGFFLTNIVLHVCNGILFYALLIRVGLGRLGAFFAAFVFLLHPVQVETVAWISERKNLLAMFFYLAAFVCYLSYKRKGWGKGTGAYLVQFSVLCRRPPVQVGRGNLSADALSVRYLLPGEIGAQPMAGR